MQVHGTVNHLKLLVERYARSKMPSQEVPRADRLQDLCVSLRKIKTFKRRCVSLHEAPADLQHLEAIFYSNQKFEYFNLDSRLHNSAKNSFVSFVSGGRKGVGQIRVFFKHNKEEFVSLLIFKIVSEIRPAESSAEICSYYEIVETKDVQIISQDSIFEKLQFIKLDEKSFLVPLIKFFEHD